LNNLPGVVVRHSATCLVVGVPAMVSMGDWMDVTAVSLVELDDVGSVPGRYILVVWTVFLGLYFGAT